MRLADLRGILVFRNNVSEAWNGSPRHSMPMMFIVDKTHSVLLLFE